MRVFSFVALTVLSFSSFCYAASPAVLVKHNDQYRGYMTLPRLSEVVTPVNTVPALYWPAARLYKTDPESVKTLELQRQELLKTLTNLKQAYLQDNEAELAASAEALYQEVKHWVLAEQLFLDLDPDRVRAKPELDPKLRAGEYLLQVSVRPETLTVAGVVQSIKVQFVNAVDASDYFAQIQLLEGASSSFLYILPATQQAIQAKIGLWNHQRQDVPAGAVLYVPFEQRDLPSDFENLNQQIIELLQHRVVL